MISLQGSHAENDQEDCCKSWKNEKLVKKLLRGYRFLNIKIIRWSFLQGHTSFDVKESLKIMGQKKLK